ncbi:MAG: hypothetical protein JWN04_4933 [Myxococcaceae bacterium]|nr:hypothetical protein [Myxococcaceae bacterium]
MLNFVSLCPRNVRALRIAALLFVSLVCSHAAADAASGTYTGSVQLRNNYYWERSTRVIAPNAVVSLDTPSGVRVDGTYLLDAITSASNATGVSTDNLFTEKRNDVQAGLGYEFDLGTSQLDLSARGRFSKEPDYLSRGAGFNAALSLDERNTVLRFNGYLVHDDVYRKMRASTAADPKHLNATMAVPAGELNVLSMGVAWDQVINRQTTLTTGYDLSLLEGYQANAYRMVAFKDGGGGQPEKHPRERARSAGYVWLSYFNTISKTAFRGGYRLYYDNWDILAHTPELRIHQEVGSHLEVRLRYRYYTQGPSFFYRKGGNLSNDRFYTADPKMSAFHDQTLGFKVRLSLDFLSFTKLGLLHDMVVDWNIEYVFNTNRYGNGVIAQGGIGFPF